MSEETNKMSVYTDPSKGTRIDGVYPYGKVRDKVGAVDLYSENDFSQAGFYSVPFPEYGDEEVWMSVCTRSDGSKGGIVVDPDDDEGMDAVTSLNLGYIKPEGDLREWKHDPSEDVIPEQQK